MKLIEKIYSGYSSRAKTAILILLFLLIVLIMQTDWGLRIDYFLTTSIYDGLHWSFWRTFFVFISTFGFGSVFGVFYVFVFLLVKEKIVVGGWYILFVLVLESAVLLIKNYYLRIRPFEGFNEIVAFSTNMLDKFSFPSAHSALAFFTAYFLAKRFNYDFSHKVMIFGIALLIALSRVYIGVHFLFDVIAGSIIGILIGMLAEWSWLKLIVNK